MGLARGRGPSAMASAAACVVLGWLAGCASEPSAAGRVHADSELAVRRGAFQKRVLLSGTLEAIESAYLSCPRTPIWQVQIRWMEEDGTFVKEGQIVLELDNAGFASDIEEKRLAVRKAEVELLRLKAQAEAQRSEKAFAVEERKIEEAKARVDAELPRDLLPLREYQEKQLALERAVVAHQKAVEDLEAHDRATAEQLAVQRANLEKTRYEIRLAEAAIEALSQRAPRDGVLVISQHPWEGRKLVVGDTVWPGFSLMEIPDLRAMRVTANLSDVDDGAITIGQNAEVVLDSHPEQVFEGRIEDITPVAQEENANATRRSFKVRVALATTDESRMRPGMAVRVEVLTTEQDDVLLLPRSALDWGDMEHPRARLADGGRVSVALGDCNELECVVEEGLEVGQRLGRSTSP